MWQGYMAAVGGTFKAGEALMVRFLIQSSFLSHTCLGPLHKAFMRPFM